jgi:hypothetical protein
MIDAPDGPAVNVHDSLASPVMVIAAPRVGDGTTVEKGTVPEIGTVNVILGTEVGGRILYAR